MQSNSHNQAVPDAVINAAEAAIDAQLQAIAPYATPLTAEDRRVLLKMGPKTFQFVALAHTLAEQNPQLTSKSFDLAAFTVDFKDVHGLLGLLNKSRQLTEILEDIVMTAGSDAHHYALEFYADVKSEASRNVPEAKTVYEQSRRPTPARTANTGQQQTKAGKTSICVISPMSRFLELCSENLVLCSEVETKSPQTVYCLLHLGRSIKPSLRINMRIQNIK